MGCYPPLGKIVSKALGNCNGKERRRHHSHANMVIMSPPPTYTQSHARKTVTFSNHNPIYIIPSDPPTSTPSSHKNHQENPISSFPHASAASPPKTTEATKPRKEHAQVRPETVQGSGAPNGWNQQAPVPTTSYSRPVPASYVMSPLPRWEEGERRRREYLGGEYRYYPTPIREGMYSMATDPNGLTAMFSEENPNACTIA